jgi:hypothetical protein
MLEDRITPADITIAPTTFADDGKADSLRGAISTANADTDLIADNTYIIQLKAGTYTLTIPNKAGYENENQSGDLNINASFHDMIIQGATDANGKPTTIIQQTVADRVFHIQNGGNPQNVIFKNLIIEGGSAQDDGADGAAAGSTKADGGGIMVEGEGVFTNHGGAASVDVTLSNVALQSNHANAAAGFSAHGGGIFVLAASLNIQNSTIQNNTALGGAGGGSAAGGGVFGSASNISISGSVVSNNTVAGGSTTNGNGGSAAGGGVSGGDVNGSFSNGLPTSLTLTNSELLSNTVRGGDAKSGGSGGAAEGGGVFASCLATVNGCNLFGSKVIGGNGGNGQGGAAEGGSVFSADTTFGPGTITIEDSGLSHNTLTGGSGTINPTTIGTLTSVITPGDVGGEAAGGGIWSSCSGKTSITGSAMQDNNLTGGEGTLNNSSASFAGDVGGEALGGGAVVRNVGATITASNFLNNNLAGGNGTYSAGTVAGSVGGAASGGGVDVSTSGGATPVITISDSTLSGNFAFGGNGSVKTLPGSTFSGGSIPGFASGGGARFDAGSTGALVNSTIADNQAIGGQSSSLIPVASGGGLYFDNSSSGNLTNVTVVGNQASPSATGQGSTSGGGIDNNNLPGKGIVTLHNTLVALNGANKGPDFAGTVTNSDHNLISVADGSSGFSAANGDLLGSELHFLNPVLGSLANNGGPTQTIALLAGSPAINAGDTNGGLVTGKFDQRGQGFARVVNGVIDIGAFEVQPPKVVPPLGVKPPPPSPAAPPTLHTPPLLAFFDGLLGGIEKVNSNETETVIDSIFGFPLLVATYNSAGNLLSVELFGIDVTFLFESL